MLSLCEIDVLGKLCTLSKSSKLSHIFRFNSYLDNTELDGYFSNLIMNIISRQKLDLKRQSYSRDDISDYIELCLNNFRFKSYQNFIN